MKKIINLFFPRMSRVRGGVENTCFYLADRFKNMYEVFAYLIYDENEDIEGLTSYFRGTKNRIYNELWDGVQYYRNRKVFNQNSSICLCASWKHAVVPYFLRKEVKSPYIIMAFGNEVLPLQAKSLKNRIMTSLRKKVIKNAVYVCTCSHYTADLVRRIDSNVQIRVIHPPIGEKIREYKKDENMKIFSIGRMDKRKGFQYVIEALPRVLERCPKAHYDIAGCGEMLEPLKSLAKKCDVEDHCTFHGRVSEEEKQKLFDECSVFIMPSFHNIKETSVEGFGIVYVEANAHGKPVIGTRSGGISDAIKDNVTGILVKEKNAQQIADAIVSVLNNEKEFDPQKCQDWAREHTVDKIVQQYMEVIDQVLSQEEKHN